MADVSADGTYTLHEIVRAVEANRQTLTLYNFEGSDQVLEELSSYFGGQSVRLRRASTTDRRPTNFLVLHRGDEFIAAAGLDAVRDVVQGEESVVDPDSFEALEYPRVISEIDQTTFTGYDRRRMISASRSIERLAFDREGGELHAGFQQLSRLQEQFGLYQSLADHDVDVHVYGAGDWTVPDERFTVHTHNTEEITRSWFVAYDGPADESRVLLAWERVSNDFKGIWTTEQAVHDAVVSRLEESYPPTDQ